jgi:hypothetical protein
MAQGVQRARVPQQQTTWWGRHKARWQPILLLALGLFLTNAIARLIVKLFFEKDADKQITVGLVWLAVTGLGMLAAAVWWALRRPPARFVADLGWAALIGCALSVVVGPFVVGSYVYAEGGAVLWGEIWHFLLICGTAMLIAYSVITAIGKDYRSVQLKRYADRQRAHPTRV